LIHLRVPPWGPRFCDSPWGFVLLESPLGYPLVGAIILDPFGISHFGDRLCIGPLVGPPLSDLFWRTPWGKPLAGDSLEVPHWGTPLGGPLMMDPASGTRHLGKTFWDILVGPCQGNPQLVPHLWRPFWEPPRPTPVVGTRLGIRPVGTRMREPPGWTTLLEPTLKDTLWWTLEV
jgi:hypothetical protein